MAGISAYPFAVLLLASLALPAMAGDSRLSGMVKFPDGGSGVVVRLGDSVDPNAPAVVLTAGHCVDFDLPEGQYVINKSYSGFLWIENSHGKQLPFYGRRYFYYTRTGTDLGLLELKESYADLQKAGVAVYGISSEKAEAGEAILFPSGHYMTVQSCAIEAAGVNILVGDTEDKIRYPDTYKLGQGCKGLEDESGSPILSVRTGKIVGVFTASSVETLVSYAQRVDAIATCVDGNGTFNLGRAGCRLFRGP